MGTIYILENRIDGKFYIGQTIKDFNKRLRQHQLSHSYIGNALRKYGIDNFAKTLLENIPEERLDEIEQELIQRYNSISPNGYNLETGGNKNKHLSEETKRKIGEAGKGRIPWNKGLSKENDERLKSISTKMNGNQNGKDHKNNGLKGKISSLKGKSITEEHKRKISQEEIRIGNKPPIQFGNKWNLGRKHSDDFKKKRSEYMKKLWIEKKNKEKK